jgi:hypothetical protein
LSLLFYEVHNKIGSEVRAGVGDVIPYETLAAIRDRAALMQYLRDRTYALADSVGLPSKEHLKKPRHAPKPGTLVPGLT